MLDVHDYTAAFDRTFAWGLYLGCGVLVMLVMTWLTHRWQRDVRLLLLGLLALAIFLPAQVPGHQASAPAFVFVALGILTGSVDVLAPVLVKFSLIGIVIVVLVVIESVWWRHRRRVRNQQAAAQTTPRRPATNR